MRMREGAPTRARIARGWSVYVHAHTLMLTRAHAQQCTTQKHRRTHTLAHVVAHAHTRTHAWAHKHAHTQTHARTHARARGPAHADTLVGESTSPNSTGACGLTDCTAPAAFSCRRRMSRHTHAWRRGRCGVARAMRCKAPWCGGACGTDSQHLEVRVVRRVRHDAPARWRAGRDACRSLWSRCAGNDGRLMAASAVATNHPCGSSPRNAERAATHRATGALVTTIGMWR